MIRLLTRSINLVCFLQLISFNRFCTNSVPMMNTYFKKFTIIFALSLLLHFFPNEVKAQGNVGIFQTYVILEVDTPGNVWLAGGFNSEQATRLDSVTFNNTPTIKIMGAEIRTFKNGSADVTGARLLYDVHPAGEPHGTFKEINIPWNQDFPTVGDQSWQLLNIDSTVTDGLADGNYELELYWKITTNQGDRFDNNNGDNFKAAFTIGTPVGIPENTPENSFELFPNPCHHKVNVQLKGGQDGQLVLSDASGRMVYNENILAHNTSIWVDVRDFDAGIYLATIRYADGSAVTSRLVVAR